MSDIKIQPSATGSATVTLTAPATGTARTVTLPDATGTLLNSDGSGANLTGLPNGSQLDHSGTKKIEAVSTGAQIQNRLEVITPNDSSTHLVQRLGSTDGSYGYVDLELVSPSSTAANLPRLDMQVGNTTVLSLQRGGRVVSQSNAHSWVNYNQVGTLAVQDSYNVSSVTDKGTGYAWVNFSTHHGNGSYAVCGMAGNHKRVTQDGAGLNVDFVAIYTSQAGQTATTDESRVFVITFGDSA